MATLSSIFTFTYSSLPSESQNAAISQWLLAHIVYMWALVWLNARAITMILIYYNQIMTAREWKTRGGRKDIVTYFAEIANIGEFITSCYFLGIWNSSDDHTYVPGSWGDATIEIIAIFMIVRLSIMILPFAIIMLMCCFPCCADIVRSMKRTRSHATVTTAFSRDVAKGAQYNQQHVQHPVPSAPPASLTTESKTNTIFQSSRNVLQSTLSYVMPGMGAPTTEICSICIIEFESSDAWKSLPCGHVFHPKCIDPWVNRHNDCPNCRAVVNTHDSQIV